MMRHIKTAIFFKLISSFSKEKFVIIIFHLKHFIGNSGFISWVVSAVGRASRLHRLSQWFNSPANPT